VYVFTLFQIVLDHCIDRAVRDEEDRRSLTVCDCCTLGNSKFSITAIFFKILDLLVTSHQAVYCFHFLCFFGRKTDIFTCGVHTFNVSPDCILQVKRGCAVPALLFCGLPCVVHDQTKPTFCTNFKTVKNCVCSNCSFSSFTYH